MAYNGWTNYETWCVNLWIDNEQADQEYWQEQAREVVDTCLPDSQVRELADLMEAIHDEAYQETCTAPGMYGDLLRAALSEVNWHEIAGHYIDAAKEEVSDANG